MKMGSDNYMAKLNTIYSSDKSYLGQDSALSKSIDYSSDQLSLHSSWLYLQTIFRTHDIFKS